MLLRAAHGDRPSQGARDRPDGERAIRRAHLSLAAVLLLASACATPIGVTHVDTQVMYRSLTSSVLSSDHPSEYSEQLLTRLGLGERFAENPEVVLAALRGPGEDLSREYLFALSELSFYHATKSQKAEYFLASAVYAWAFILGRTDEARVEPIDPRLRLATNLYNLGIAQGLAGEGEATVVIESGSRPLPFGKIEISVDDKMLLWSSYRMVRFISLGEYKVRGFLNRYRQAGIGAPLAAELAPVGAGPEAEEARKRIPPRLKVPVTAVLRIEDVSTGIATGNVQARIEVYAADAATTVKGEGGRDVPLELEPTAALAYQLEGAPIWDTELGQFLSALKSPPAEGLLMMHPYRPGRVPVVLVHGTASSPARWADIINELQNDPKLRGRIQFWLFTYNTSNPILLSAADLRLGLQRIRKEIDPDGRDPALNQLVVIGHSQGGLLTRLMVTDSGTRRPVDLVRSAQCLHRHPLRRGEREPRDAGPAPAHDLLRAPAVHNARGLRRHAASGQLPSLLVRARHRAEARHPAAHGDERRRGARDEEHRPAEGSGSHGRGQHAARTPLRPDIVFEPHRAGRHGTFDHPRHERRAARGTERHGREIRERPYRRSRV